MTELLPRLLLVLGIGFLAANLLAAVRLLRFLRLRRTAILTWPGKKPPFYGLLLFLGVVLGLLVFVKVVVQQRPPMDAFGEFMMLIYYGYLAPLSVRVGRGFYEDGVWFDAGEFLPYSQIGGIAWREGEEITLVLISRAKQLAYRLVVPQRHYSEARRLLRDRIKDHEIHLGERLDLGGDERDKV